MNSKKYILGSGLVALICRKILGPDWKIIPLGPSRFYSKGVPALGDDFVVMDPRVTEIIKDWGLDVTTPLFYKRPLSISGELMYNDVFIDSYLEKVGWESNPQVKDCLKSNLTVYKFSCVQLWNRLVRECVSDIKEFHQVYKDAKTIKDISNHIITLDNGARLDYDQVISTIPHHALCKMMKIQEINQYLDTYYYFIKANSIDLEGANQAFVCDPDIPFHKCTKISGDNYIFEIIDQYFENIYEVLMPILGGNMDIINAQVIQNAHMRKGIINPSIEANDITCVGSYAQCDPLIDLSSVINRVHNLLKNQTVKQ